MLGRNAALLLLPQLPIKSEALDCCLPLSPSLSSFSGTFKPPCPPACPSTLPTSFFPLLPLFAEPKLKFRFFCPSMDGTPSPMADEDNSFFEATRTGEVWALFVFAADLREEKKELLFLAFGLSRDIGGGSGGRELGGVAKGSEEEGASRGVERKAGPWRSIECLNEVLSKRRAGSSMRSISSGLTGSSWVPPFLAV